MTRREIILSEISAKYGSIAEFSRQTGIPDSSIRNIKNKKDDYIDRIEVTRFLQIASALDLDAEALLQGTIKRRDVVLTRSFDPVQRKILDITDQLNATGKDILLGIGESLVKQRALIDTG